MPKLWSCALAVSIFSVGLASGQPKETDITGPGAAKSISTCKASKTSMIDCYIGAVNYAALYCDLSARSYILMEQIDVANAAEEAAAKATAARADWARCSMSARAFLKPHLDAAVQSISKNAGATKAAKDSYAAAKVAIEMRLPERGETALSYKARIVDQDRRLNEALARLESEM